MTTDGLVQGSFSHHLFLMKIISIYPFDSNPILFKLFAFFSYIFMTLPVAILPLIFLIATKETDLNVIAQNGYVIIELLIISVKVLPLKVKPEQTVKTVTALDKEIFNRQMEEQDYILVSVEFYCRLIYRMFSMSVFMAVASWACMPLMYEHKSFPFGIWLPFDPFQSIFVYTLVYIWMLMSVASSAIANSTFDSMIALLMYHAAGQLRVLKNTLTHLGRRTDEEVSKMGKSLTEKDRTAIKKKIIYQRICQCVDHYNAIYEYVEDMEETFNLIVFGQFLASIMVICICIFQLSAADPLSIPFASAVCFTIAILSEQFLFCYSGTLLYEESITVVDAIYMSDWNNYDEKSKKALFTLMERAKRPMVVTAGKLLDLSLETFTMIIRRSFSLLAVLKNY